MEIRVVATIVAKPEFKKQVTEALLDVIEPSRQEVGCLQYELHGDLDKEGTFVFYERWASEDALKQHNKTEHFQHFAKSLEGKLEELTIRRLKTLV
ncbi:putative quinol monooxygenase [Rahnella contaminans]|uniref:putative quinol monooxygenase n=1 Tax=Rahnella contaminans TaxID=2703882 RepID=UPI003C2B63D6